MNHPIAALLAFLLALAGCAETNSGPTGAPTGPGTAYPCGTEGRECRSHACCALDENCGGDPGVANCPTGMCCWNGEGGGEAQPYWSRRPHPQTPEQR